MVSSELQSRAKSSEYAEPPGSLSGGSRALTGGIAGKGLTPESRQNSARGQAHPAGSRGDNSALEAGEPDEFVAILFHQQSRAGEELYQRAECQGACRLKIGLLHHQRAHTKKRRVSPYVGTDCGRSFGRHADSIRHRGTRAGEKPYKCTECDKSFGEKPRLTRHLQTHNVGV